jgi:hypothetical protein
MATDPIALDLTSAKNRRVLESGHGVSSVLYLVSSCSE